MSEIEGKATRVGASECGQRASFKAGTEERSNKRRTAPWLVSSHSPLNLFEPRIAKRFEAGAEEDRAVAQALKLGCRLAPPSHLRLVKPNRIQRKIYPTKSAHTSMSPMPGVLERAKCEQRAAYKPAT